MSTNRTLSNLWNAINNVNPDPIALTTLRRRVVKAFRDSKIELNESEEMLRNLDKIAEFYQIKARKV